ncbi:ATP-binding cassette domain-containing protein [Solicola sp. PLA-1-18]|uniref:ATP-binding cassette domain-containing protein n=1 Tax=Solicola sp. PLA-1-18 TaxID=3380532 RepID=UPI003B78880E
MAARPRARPHGRARLVRRGARAPRRADGLSVPPRGALALRGFTWTPLGRRAPAVDRLDLEIPAGQRVLLAGPSGSGKSTVLRALAGVLTDSVPGDADGEVVRDGVAGLLLQNPGDSVVAATVGRDVAFGPENAAVPRPEIWRRVHAALDAVDLGLPVDHPTRAMSGGQLQRLALCGVLALGPDALLLDEPTSMLDAASAAAVREAVVAAADATGATLVVVEHRLAPWLEHVHRVLVLDGGTLVADTDPEGFVARHASRLGDLGVWVPGLDAPTPLAVPSELVAPDEAPLHLAAEAVGVDLRVRTLRGPTTTRALRGVDADLPPGSVSALTGVSGAGKSTLAAVLAGLVRPSAGRVRGTDRPLHRWASHALARQVGWVPQDPEHGFLTRSVADEIALTAGRCGRAVDVEAVASVLRLDHLLGADPFRLSGGEQRRLATAAALAHRPGVLLLDEPTVGQDRGTWAAVTGWARAASAVGAAVGVVTHDDDVVALADHVVALADGVVVA